MVNTVNKVKRQEQSNSDFYQCTITKRLMFLFAWCGNYFFTNWILSLNRCPISSTNFLQWQLMSAKVFRNPGLVLLSFKIQQKVSSSPFASRTQCFTSNHAQVTFYRCSESRNIMTKTRQTFTFRSLKPSTMP